MFENYDKSRGGLFSNRWFLGFVAVSIIGHVAVGGYMLVSSMWDITYSQLPQGDAKGYEAALPPPPPPPPAKKTIQYEVVEAQPLDDEKLVEIDPDDFEEGQDNGVEGGVIGGVEGGVAGGVVGGVIGGKLGAPPPPPPKEEIVPPNVLRSKRLSGSDPQPDRPTKIKMSSDGINRVIGVWKICVSRSGSVKSVKRQKSTGYSPYDRKLERAMKRWKYSPTKIDGRAVDVCSTLTVIYKMDKRGM